MKDLWTVNVHLRAVVAVDALLDFGEDAGELGFVVIHESDPTDPAAQAACWSGRMSPRERRLERGLSDVSGGC